MTVRAKLFSLPRKAGLTAEQIHMYSQERMMNFRWISRIMATYSPHTLNHTDLASLDVAAELSELSQFANVAYSPLPTTYIFDNLDLLMEADFPLEGYDALQGTMLVSVIRGKVANLGAYVAYRPATRQLVVGISGTSNISQALQDLETLKHKHPAGEGCAVHAGFWKMYKGIKPEVIDAVKKGLCDYDVTELVLTGHSLGGALSYLLAIDLLVPGGLELPTGLALKLAAFGSPRCGNVRMLQMWVDLTKKYRAQNGEESLKEYSVKAYNDGVPSLPPKAFGFRHFALNPLYLMQGHLYHTPSSEAEFCLFHISTDDRETGKTPLYPLGGHNYYLRDLERFVRRTEWIANLMAKNNGLIMSWEDQYRAKVAKRERKWNKNSAETPIAADNSSGQ